MDRGRLLRLTTGLVGLVLCLWIFDATAAVAACSQSQISAGTCESTVEVGLTDEEAILTGTQPGTPPGVTPGTQPDGDPSGTPAGPPAPVCTLPAPRCQEWGVVVLTPTLNDIAAFRPTPNVDHMEPNGWFVVGLDANFYATGGSSVVDGTLLGYPASVRFTPIRWTWTYGDGSSATRSTRGGTWSALGIREFDPTPTSHVYERAGTYYIDLTVGYRAEYTFNGGSWGTIPGTLWLPANRLVATVGGAKTVLVERDCTANPGGPGC